MSLSLRPPHPATSSDLAHGCAPRQASRQGGEALFRGGVRACPDGLGGLRGILLPTLVLVWVLAALAGTKLTAPSEILRALLVVHPSPAT